MLNDFYTITELTQTEVGKYVCNVLLNKNHLIFKGHFPDNPVTPGVCMLQIIKNITENITHKKLFLSKTSNVKFMALINPETNAELTLTFEITENTENVTVKNTTSFGETVALKLSNTYRIC